jgi:hypothetical protein
MKREVHLTLDPSAKETLAVNARNFDKKHLFYENTQDVADGMTKEILNVLPKEITDQIKAMITEDGPDLLSVSNLPLEDTITVEEDLEKRIQEKSRISEYCLLGLSSLLEGKMQTEDSSHQKGLIHQLTPVKSFEHESSGRGKAGLPFHVENVFVKNPPSFLCLICVVGEKNVGTEYIFLEDIVKYLGKETIQTLKKPIYTIFTGDGFKKKQLTNSPVIESLGNKWQLGRFYEEDRIITDSPEGKEAVKNLHTAIVKARDTNHNSVDLEPGTLLIFRNGTGKGRVGGVMHGRRGQIGENQQKTSAMRWLQRLCVEIPYN